MVNAVRRIKVFYGCLRRRRKEARNCQQCDKKKVRKGWEVRMRVGWSECSSVPAPIEWCANGYADTASCAHCAPAFSAHEGTQHLCGRHVWGASMMDSMTCHTCWVHDVVTHSSFP